MTGVQTCALPISGDFAAVKRQASILDSTLEPLEFLEQLEAEHRIKPEVRESRGMGFLQ